MPLAIVGIASQPQFNSIQSALDRPHPGTDLQFIFSIQQQAAGQPPWCSGPDSRSSSIAYRSRDCHRHRRSAWPCFSSSSCCWGPRPLPCCAARRPPPLLPLSGGGQPTRAAIDRPPPPRWWVSCARRCFSFPPPCGAWPPCPAASLAAAPATAGGESLIACSSVSPCDRSIDRIPISRSASITPHPSSGPFPLPLRRRGAPLAAAVSTSTTSAAASTIAGATTAQRVAALGQVREELAKRGVDAFIVPSGDPHLSEYPAVHFWAPRLPLRVRRLGGHGGGDGGQGAALDGRAVPPAG